MHNTVVVQEYDVIEAILKAHNINLYEADYALKVTHICDDKILVMSDVGNFVCEAFEDGDALVYMKVYPLVG
jgi:hypothetical protein